MKKMFWVMAITILGLLQATAQMQEQGGRTMPPGENMIGKVTAISKDSLTIAKLEGGESVTIKISDATRVTRSRQHIKLEEIKVDETIFARGEIKSGVMQAAMVAVVNPEMAQRFAGGGTRGAGARGGAAGFKPEDMGKKFIIGQVKAINETKLTIARPDGQTQEIEVDENTSFKKDGASITLPDIQVGDSVRGRGELKGTTFVPKELVVGGRPMRGLNGPGGNQMPDRMQPNSASPSTPAPSTATPAPAVPTTTPTPK
ncbi:MAG TPA: DUF5666 domain-containing protein [Candidatus Angelobacter sp.]|nr:DUF5666 domain-containing protein [Candidatus Angelobacter sp.]